ncbi:MAG: hypothetical protein AAFQ01_01535, partial [Bacteroidota bacterium]
YPSSWNRREEGLSAWPVRADSTHRRGEVQVGGRVRRDARKLPNQGILGDRLATTFGLPDGWLLVLVTGLWGAIGAGLAAWAGQAVRQAVKPIAKA